MSFQINEEQKLGEIVALCPGASDVFVNNKIDFCCGGNRSIKEAANEANINSEKILREIDKKYDELRNMSKEHIDWTTKTSTELIEHIVAKHHGYLRNELPKLSELICHLKNIIQ